MALSLIWPGLILLLAIAGPLFLVVRAASARQIGRLIDAFRYVGPLIATAAALRTLCWKARSTGPSTDPSSLNRGSATRDDSGQLATLRVLSWLRRGIDEQCDCMVWLKTDPGWIRCGSTRDMPI